MRRFLPLAAALALLAACAQAPKTGESGTVTLLMLNDVYRIEGVEGGATGGLARFRALRAELAAADPDLIVLHAGDFLYPSLLSRSYDGAQMIDVLNRVDGDPAGYDERPDNPYTRLEGNSVYHQAGFFPQAGRNVMGTVVVSF